MKKTLLGLLLLLGCWSVDSRAAVSKDQLLRLVESNIEDHLIVALILKDCVDFEVDADALLELGGRVPAEVLNAAIACGVQSDEMGSSTARSGTKSTVADIALPEKPALTLKAVKRIAVIPVVVNGGADPAFTGALIEKLSKRQDRYDLVDPFALAVHFEDTGSFHSNAPIKSLLAAARSQKADAILLSTGSLFRGGLLGIDPGARLDARLVEVNRGEVLWSLGVQALGAHWQDAKGDVSRKLAKQIPR